MIRLLTILVVFLILIQFVKAETWTKLRIPTDTVQNIEGKRIYTITCTKCHNVNPHKPGIIGPELFTTPREVFHTKVPLGTYPPGYKSKRKTRVMPKFKHLTKDIDRIYEYIQSIPK